MDLRTRVRRRQWIPTKELAELWAKDAEVSETSAIYSLAILIEDGRLPIYYRNGDKLHSVVMSLALHSVAQCIDADHKQPNWELCQVCKQPFPKEADKSNHDLRHSYIDAHDFRKLLAELGVTSFESWPGLDVSSEVETKTKTDSPNPESGSRLVLTGDFWTVTFKGESTTLKNTLGMRYIAHLIRNQGKEIHVCDLYYAINSLAHEATDDVHSSISTEQLAEFGLSISDLGDAGELLTPGGKKRLQAYLKELQDHIEDAKEMSDVDRQAELEEKREDIGQQLSADLGLGGRPRKASSTVERLRKSVTKRIRKGRVKIKEEFPELGNHLDCIKTRTFCQYAPPSKVEWHFDPF
jgi:hypothetical protein